MSQPDPQKQDNAKPLPASLRAMRAALRGKEAPPSATDNKDDDKDLFPVTATQKKQEKEAAEKAKRAAAQKEAIDALIGTEIQDDNGKSKGLYLGPHKIKDRTDKMLGEFNLYAAPQNLVKKDLFKSKKLLFEFNQAVEYVASLKDYHGYKGFDHFKVGKPAEDMIFEALDDGSYNGEWFIPPNEMLVTLGQKKNKGALAGTFDTKDLKTSRYWSCTENLSSPFFVSSWDVSNGTTSWLGRDSRQSIRLVRAEPVGKASPLPPVGIRHIN